jgi:hypothetical protein
MKLLDHNYDKHLLISIMVLIALPILLGSSNFFSEVYSEKIISFFLVYFDDPYLGFQILYSFQYIVFAVMLVLYPIYPFIFSIEKYFSKRNPKSAVSEYEILKKIVYSLFPFFIFAVAFMIVSRIIQEDPLSNLVLSLGDPTLVSLFLTSIGVIFFVVGSAMLRIILLNKSKQFRFYLAKMSFRALSKEGDEVERMRYLIKGLSSYNKYIRRNLGLQINDLKTIYSRIVSDPTIDKSHSVNELSVAFEDNDKLKTIRCLTGLLKIKDTEHFLVKESIGKKLQDWAGILGTLASAIAAILGALATLEIPGIS